MAFDEKLFQDNFSFGVRASIANTIRIATAAFTSFWKDNASFLNGADELYGRILDYAVKRQFQNSAPLTSANYFASIKETNFCKGSAVFLDTHDYVINVCRTVKPNRLPCKAAYKLRLAQGNREDVAQMELFLPENDNQLSTRPPKHYAIIGYRYFNQKLQHLNILVPDPAFTSILYSLDLLKQITEYYHYVPEKLVEENVATLKSEILQAAQIKNLIVSGE